MSEPMVAQYAQTSWATGSSPWPAAPPVRSPAATMAVPWPWRPPVMELVVVLPAAAEVLGVLVDGVPVGQLGPGRLGHRLPPAGAVGEHPQPLGFQHVGVVPWGSETRTSCRDLVVLVNETAESVPAPNAGGDCYRIRPSPNLDTSGRPKREASVRPLIVVVPQVLVEHPLKMTPTPDQHPIQTLLPHRPHPALGERVGVRRLNRGLDDLDAVSGEDVVEGAGELGIPVTKEEPRGGSALRPFHLYREFPCPLDDPSSVRMVGDAR